MSIRLSSLFKRLPPRSGSKPITIVSGLPRSGTSMMMRMLEAGGVSILTDNLREAEENNPNGYYEFERVKKLREGDNLWLDNARGKAVKIVSAHLEHLPPGYFYRVIFMRRDMNEILASQQKMLASRNEPTGVVSDEKLSGLYYKHLQEIEAWLNQQSNFEVLYVSYNEILENPQEDLLRLSRFLGGKLDVRPMAGIIDQSLYRQRKRTR